MRIWLRYGHVLRTVGRSAECVAAYRRAVTLDPAFGEAWWSLADLKTFRFSAEDIASMNAEAIGAELRGEDRCHLHFALGKAMEDDGQYRSAFHHYAQGNAARRAQVRWDGDAAHAYVLACERLLTKGFFAERSGAGAVERDPIFIIGLPRAGSTLIEQILSSHSQVEGTMELPTLGAVARRLGSGAPGQHALRHLQTLATLPVPNLADLGRAYLAGTRRYRRTNKPRFIDKMPDNFNFVGLIHLALPKATIIDARRHPMATCFSAWKQCFTKGQGFTYDLGELGRHYRDYVRLMAHFDHELPGRVLRVCHEDLVTDTEVQVRRLLHHCGLPYESGCMAHHLNPRPIRTASSEQVRRPISADGLDQWRHFEPFLEELAVHVGSLTSAEATTP